MRFSGTNNVRAGYGWIVLLLFALAASLLTATPARADDCVKDRGGVIDGFVDPVPPSQIQIDGNCTIRNFPASNPLTSNISFYTQPGQNQQRWLVIFDNVVHTGQMSCDAVHGHLIWFVNSSASDIKANCQNLFIPVEKIDKQNPAGTTTATIGVPFTYTLTIPILYDAATGTVVNSQGSPNDLHDITVTDDLNATGADLSYVSHKIYWKDDGTPVPHTFSNVGGVLTFSNFPIIPAGRQFVIEITVVLNDSPTNLVGNTFFNTAKWEFGRLIDGVFYEPLPGEWGVTPPLTIAAPQLVVTKSGPATMNLGQWGDFTLDVQNTGLSDAWDTSIRDLLPDGPTGGMCDRTPEIQSMQVFQADGVTPVPGKGPLNQGTDYTLSYSAAPTCQLDITMLTSAGVIGPNERLIIHYRTQLDSDTQDGVTLTNIAGAIQWFNGDKSNSQRVAFDRILTDGTPGILDFQDAHTVNTSVTGYLFEKTVEDRTSGANPATTAAPGDILRYTLRFQTANGLSNFSIHDEMDALNAQASFVPNSLTLVSYPAGANISGTSGTGGAKGTGVLDVSGLNVAANGEITIQFDIQLATSLANNTVVSDQASLLLADSSVYAVSDDPNVNGSADPNVAGDENPTTVTIVSAPQFLVQKTSTDLTGDPNILLPGDTLRYTITVKNIGNQDSTNAILRDQIPANTTYVAGSTTLNGATVPDSGGTSPLVNGMPINSPGAASGTMIADTSNSTANVATITFDVVVDPNAADGTVISNQGFVSDQPSGVIDTPSDDPDTATPNDPTLDTVSLVGYIFEKTVSDPTSGNLVTTAAPGQTLRYTLRFRTTNQPLSNFSIYDEMDALNSLPSFVPGSLTLVSYPAGADITNTSNTGGAKGTGVLDVRNMSVPAGGEIIVQFDIQLATALANNTVVANQATVRLAGNTVFALSDDPNVNGPADPQVSGDEDPTRVTINSAPQFLVQKISTDLTGDPNVLRPGDTLRYTITVKNIGNENATNVTLRDLVPANTSYVANSTTLNGTAVADSGGLSPLVNGMLINSPADSTPGAMPADASSSTNNVATITFDVVVDPNVVDGTVISNQGFVTAPDNGIFDYPSDDPNTTTPNDPTRDIVGNLPLLYAAKSVTILVDNGTPGIVDPGDVLRYTITVQNSGSVAATGVVLTDAVPANTTYVANSTFLNTLPVGQPDNGVSPLASGIDISSSDLTPPLPGAGAGTISPGQTATLQYDLTVDIGTAPGTVISNQAVVGSTELPDLLTDGDGNPSTGPEPTVVVVGDAQQLSITKQVAVVGGGAAIPGAEIEYTVTVTNVSSVPAINVVITDDLGPLAGQLNFVNGSAMLNGSSAGVSFGGTTVLTADYSATYGPLGPGEVAVLRFRGTLDPSLTDGTVVTNTSVVSWNNPTQTESASVSLVVGGVPGYAVLNGSAWHDPNFNNVRDSGEQPLIGWAVELYRDGTLLNTVQTDPSGNYRFVGVQPNDTSTSRYELRFHAPGAGANTASLGMADSPFTNGPQKISDIVVSSGANLQGLNLPIDPDGVVYNSVARVPVAGATLTVRNATTGMVLSTNCFDDAAQQGQVTLADGYYKFDLNFKDSTCPTGDEYLIEVTPPPGTTYIAGASQIIPPTTDASTAAFSVPGCPGTTSDAIPATTQYCEAAASDTAPATSVAPRSAGTTYYLHLMENSDGMPGTSQIFNNHIPLDPDVSGSVVLTKTTPLRDVSRGQLVPYTITLNNTAGLALTDVGIVDRMPAGFTYIKGSARLDGVPTEPVIANGTLSWNGLTVSGTQVITIKLLLAVGAGVSESEYVNRAQAQIVATGAAISGEATARVRVVPDPTFDCTDVIGKVFNDLNRNGRQDDGEGGLQGVRVVTARGLQATTDQYGRYHITCAITPNDLRGSNFVLKLDDRSLPSGYRMSTDQVQVKRVTRGKAMKFNFGASVYRVVAIDLSDEVFEPGKTEIRIQWQPRLGLLLKELRKAPSILRLSYIADTEDPGLVKQRVEAVKKQLSEAWETEKHSYVLTIEPEIFWRRGAPPKRPRVPRSKSGGAL